MPTTTIRIDDDLKTRIAAAAARAGNTPHGFMLDAISRGVEQAEQAQELDSIADARWRALLAEGKTVPWEEVRHWLTARALGESPPRPKARKPRP